MVMVKATLEDSGKAKERAETCTRLGRDPVRSGKDLGGSFWPIPVPSDRDFFGQGSLQHGGLSCGGGGGCAVMEHCHNPPGSRIPNTAAPEANSHGGRNTHGKTAPALPLHNPAGDGQQPSLFRAFSDKGGSLTLQRVSCKYSWGANLEPSP